MPVIGLVRWAGKLGDPFSFRSEGFQLSLLEEEAPQVAVGVGRLDIIGPAEHPELRVS